MTDTTVEPPGGPSDGQAGPDTPAAAAAGAPATASARAVRETPIGPLLLAATDKGLVNVVFHASGRILEKALTRLSGRLGAAGSSPAADAHLATAVTELDHYFDGATGPFTVPLDWSLTGGFHERVLRELAAGVPYGTTVGYQDLALRVGDAGAARAVGLAMGANPLPVVVPCHRVLESSGAIGGFGGGLETKRRLLALEGILPQPLF
ncbi:methylated-DNA--[protein]-cysteine S-methyltransferase [Streptomyces diacarni]|uniref:Methylated-DNA--protein-cysteine methyltransferase n=1 Tax=Streptomyces diacarni TaxID=2800381 RepID=A0A367F8P3_9ACTN|nr:methylated-DNA--[protein]-cysteine S-methyltransferase [Streptomyces diacarni]RCG26723.1 methylated-DNA--[protein]-cysteine S-methyltransferase [Streptomyces diacarni]